MDQENKQIYNEKKDIMANSNIAAVSYLPVLCLISLLFRKDSRYVLFHAKQGTALMFLGIIFWFLPAPLNILFELLVFVGIFIGFYHASIGSKYMLPMLRWLLGEGN